MTHLNLDLLYTHIQDVQMARIKARASCWGAKSTGGPVRGVRGPWGEGVQWVGTGQKVHWSNGWELVNE